MAKLGMDVDAIRALAGRLDAEAQRIQGVIGAVDALVRRISGEWHGHNEQRFVGDWHRVFRPSLQRAQDSVVGLARSARNNARDQDVVSGAGSMPSLTTPFPRVRPTNELDLSRLLGFPDRQGDIRPRLSMWPPGVITPELRRIHQWWERLDQGESVHQSHAWSWQPTVSRHGETDLGGVPAHGEMHANAFATTSESSHAGVSIHGADAGFAAAAGVGIAAGASGMVGSHDANLSGDVEGTAGVRANADGNAHIGPDGASAKLGAGAFAGASVDGSLTGHVTGVDALVGAHGYAGVGAHLDADASISAQDVKLDFDAGAALGIGGGVKFEVDIRPDEIIKALPHWW